MKLLAINLKATLIAGIALMLAVVAQQASVQADQGENIALHKPVTFGTPPNYPYSGNDPKSITDGIYVSPSQARMTQNTKALWVQPGTVGWGHSTPAVITIDLEQVQPIEGVSLSTAAGSAAGSWPLSLVIYTSEDGKTWRYDGDLVQFALRDGPAPPPLPAYHTFRYVTHHLRTRGRYVTIVAAAGSYFTFTDEIEIYRGPDSALEKPVLGPVVNPDGPVGEMGAYVVKNLTRFRMLRLFNLNVDQVNAELNASTMPAAQKNTLRARLTNIEAEMYRQPNPDPATFRAVAPLNPPHAKLLSLHASILHARGLPNFFATKGHRYDWVQLLAMPQKPAASPSLSVRMMGNEYRADAFLLTNTSPNAITAKVRVTGLPGGAKPAWLRLSAMPWTDTLANIPVAAALPDATYANGAYQVPVSSGMTRKVWLTVDSSKLKAGQYSGALLVAGAGKQLRLPFSLRVSSVRMARPRMNLYVWDYSNQEIGGLTFKNRAAAIALMRSHFVDTTWATRKSGDFPTAADFDENNQLKRPLDFRGLDEWIKMWPDARRYILFYYPEGVKYAEFAGAKAGTPAFNARLGAWAKAYADHARKLSLKPGQLALMQFDEISTDEQAQNFANWTSAVKAAAPDLGIAITSSYVHPEKVHPQEGLTQADILIPTYRTVYKGGPEALQWYREQQAKGHRLNFYNPDGPIRLFDPSIYYRLQAWQAFRFGATGQGFYSIMGNGNVTNLWNEYSATTTIWSPVFMDHDTVIDSIHWQAVREGMEDYEYLSMLRDAASHTKNAALKNQALSLLKQGPETVIGKFTSGFDWQQDNIYRWEATPAHAVVDTYRYKALTLLEQMRSATASKSAKTH